MCQNFMQQSKFQPMLFMMFNAFEDTDKSKLRYYRYFLMSCGSESIILKIKFMLKRTDHLSALFANFFTGIYSEI